MARIIKDATNLERHSESSDTFKAAAWIVGTTPSTTGSIRLPKDGTIKARDSANSVDLECMTLDGVDNLYIGSLTGAVAPLYVEISGGTGTNIQGVLELTSSHCKVIGDIEFDKGVVTPEVKQLARTTSGDATDLLLRPQSAYSGGRGGDLIAYTGDKAGDHRHGNFALFGVPTDNNWRSLSRGMFILDSVAQPSGAPAGGIFVYSSSGAGKGMGSSGTERTWIAADPHCPNCGRDAVDEFKNEREGWELSLCLWCLTDALEAAGIPSGVIVKRRR